MNEKSVEKEECIETNEKDRVEEKERLRIFDSSPILSKESEHFEFSNEKEYELEKSENSIEEEHKEKEVVALDKSEVSSYVQNFLTQNLENKGSLDYNIYKTISFFHPTSYICFDHFLQETKFYYFTLNFL
ncbi:hypothetical protein M9H77_02196 [Catharanthus roseus]|uniref:Uncharacterized protein n=1 Tax=Catharanthus roseus TaxID=4058 RepID=A0ACC0C852_CATRO|nr:hypothetical protein M9H77_02196 [Catharanthus roseus]